MLRFVSGVPWFEEKYSGRIEWDRYCRETNCFIPCWYKNYDKYDSHTGENEAEMVGLMNSWDHVSLWSDNDNEHS